MYEVERKDEVAAGQAIEDAIRASRPGRVSIFLDKCLEPFSPGLVSSRLEKRQKLGYQRAMLAYSAAMPPAVDLQRQGVFGSLTSEEAQIPGFQRFQMMIEARDQYANFPIIRALVDGHARRSVGSGIEPIFHTSDSSWNREADRQWKEFEDCCDIRRTFDIQGIARQIIKSCFVDGDLGIRFCDEDGDLRLQITEGDLIAMNNRVSIDVDTYTPIGGVILNQTNGRPIGYMVGRRGVGGLLVDSEVVPAESFLMLYRQQRVDQVRGVPLLAPVLQTSRDLDRYMTATRMQANIAATYGVVVKREASAQIALAQSMQSNGNQNYRTMPLKTGLMTFLNPGEDISVFKPDVPGNQFDPFARFLVRIIAIGAGTTYEMLMQDFSGMSFSSSRTNMLDANLTMAEWQRFLIKKFFYRTYCVWVAKRMASGRLPMNPEAYDAVSWQRPAELGVDPQKDAASNVQLLAAGLTTFRNVYRQDGKNYEAFLKQKADEAALIDRLAKERGIQPEQISSLLVPGVVKPKEEDAKPNPLNPDE